MPIFQADLDHERDSPSPRLSPAAAAAAAAPIDIGPPPPRLRRLSEESLRLELCEGPVPDSPGRPPRPDDEAAATSDRCELIERLKRGESPTWIPNRHLESILQQGTNVHRPVAPSAALLPPAHITPASPCLDQTLRDGLAIERPRSALHTGDFTHDQTPVQPQPVPRPDVQAAAIPWIATSPPRGFTPFRPARGPPAATPDRTPSGTPLPDSTRSFRSAPSPLSSSLSSSFAYQPPTTPLVQSESNDELDFAMPPGSIDISAGQRSSRHHTLTSPHSSPPESPPCSTPWTAFQRRHGSLPYQAHQPRRSLASTPSSLQYATSPQTLALLRSRRPSFSSDASPIQHASMVGSYEESILRGRMSTTPSKPFDFLAQIGVLGKGKCKSSLRCPAHVTLPFPAVYYSYSSTPHGRSQSDDGPSPYVGQIDLENGLPNLDDESRTRRKAQSRFSDRRPVGGDLDMMTGSDLDAEPRRTPRPRRRSGSPKAPPGGSYRIPEKGQIQIVIKNQNKTAVKLFLVPYDLAGMEPGTKTFIRQRSYSAGPIMDHVPSVGEGDSMSRPILRYLVHLHMCCPSRGRFYLYKSIRVVFANRVPEGKEKLRNETTWPEPRFTPYKPIRVMHPPAASASGPAAMLAADKALRRRSLGVAPGGGGGGGGNTLPVDPLPFPFRLPPPARDCRDSDASVSTCTTGAPLRSASSSQASRPSTTTDSAGLGTPPSAAAHYEKLSRGDAGYGGYAFARPAGPSGPAAAAEGLLSRRLRSLGVKPQPPSPPPPPPPPGAHDD